MSIKEANQSQPPVCWEAFFRCQRSPLFRSQLLMALLSGTTIQVDHLPITMLLDVVLLATAARGYCEAEIVDDYGSLVAKVREVWDRPDYTARVFDSIHGLAANFIVYHGRRKFACFEEEYIPIMVGWYLRHESPNYFKREIETKVEWRKALR
jgi:hypothetical protein